MKKQFIAAALLTASVMAQSAEPAHGADAHPQPRMELGVSLGYDDGTAQNLKAFSLAVPIASTGFMGGIEYAAGQHGSAGSDVATLKIAKELANFGPVELGANVGVARLSGYEEGEKISGYGVSFGAELSYPFNENWALKLEASRFTGLGDISHVKANVVQAGVVFKF